VIVCGELTRWVDTSCWVSISRADSTSFHGSSAVNSAWVVWFILNNPSATLLVYGIIPMPAWLLGTYLRRRLLSHPSREGHRPCKRQSPRATEREPQGGDACCALS
jgi:hypothetical protein